ncbi:MAG: GNAT family N-acetyltransferase [Lachnospiraceae bacterium]|nr:GNAT family N-acetyltransferase [Lachnospiraceae bacterium]
MAQVTIKKVEYSELDKCAELIRDSFNTVAKEFGLTYQNCPTNGAFIKTSRLVSDWNKGNLMFGLYYDAILVGFMELELTVSDVYTLEKLAVHPDFRHLGYGTALLSYAGQIAIENHISKISIGIIEENTRLKCWYHNHGFTHTRTVHFEHLPFKVGFMEQRI